MRVRWLRLALANLDHIASYIAQDNPVAARQTVRRIVTAINTLAANPQLDISKAGRVPGTRELVVDETYIMPYRIRNEVLEVLRVMHARQRWPNRFP